MKLLIYISSIIIHFSFSIKTVFHKNELNLNLLPSTKYKLTNSDYQRLKNEIEIQTISKLLSIQRNYDTRDYLRSLYLFQPHLNTNSLPLIRIQPVHILKKNISPNVNEIKTYTPTNTTPQKGYTIHITEEQIKDLLAMKKELENEIALQKQYNVNSNNDNIRSIGENMVLSPSLTENGENIVINTKTNEIGKIVKMNNDDSIDERITREEDNNILNEIYNDYNKNNTLFKQVFTNSKPNINTNTSSSLLYKLFKTNNNISDLTQHEFSNEYNSLSKQEKSFLSSLIKSNLTKYINSTNL